MNCCQSRGLFGAYWDDELTQAEREGLEAHFAGCPSCRGEYDELARTLELVGSLPRVEVAPGLDERALAKARRAVPVPDRIPVATSRWIPITATAALLAISGATVIQWTGTLAPRSAARQEMPSVQEPMLVEGSSRPTEPVLRAAPGTSEPVAVAGRGAADRQGQVALSDSLWEQGDDVEFILDAMTLRKGRAHPTSRLTPHRARGERAVITF
ncbi:MAG TPA: anti-sigma factor [Candidatus Eisenbacteria bacterium]|jgi:hypothetical protein